MYYNDRPIESRMCSAIFNDLEKSLIQFRKSRHYLTLNISETVRYRPTDIVKMKYQLRLTPYSIMSFWMTLSDLEWHQHMQWHEASRGLSATVELPVCLESQLYKYFDAQKATKRCQTVTLQRCTSCYWTFFSILTLTDARCTFEVKKTLYGFLSTGSR